MPSFLSRVLPDATADDLRRLSGRRDDLLVRANVNDPAELFQLAERIHIAPGEIRITLDAAILAHYLDVAATRIVSEALTFTAPFQHRKRGVETRLILSDGQNARDDVLLRNMVRAQQWLEAIKSGKSFDEVAAETDTTRWFLRHPMPSDWEAQRRLVRAL